MCGLFGAIGGTIVSTEADRIIDLGTVSTIRGYDSSGAIVLRRGSMKNGAHITYHKSDLTWSEMIQTKDFRDKFSLQDKVHLTGFLGHTRAATIGKISAKNAHPFHVGSVIGMHNGTVSSLNVPPGSTDSKELLGIIDKEGITAAVHALRVGDAAALVWVDIPTSKIHIWRNSLRTLYHTTAAGVLYYASEAAFLELVLSRKHVTKLDIKPFKTDTLYTFDIGSCHFSEKELKKTYEPWAPSWMPGEDNSVPFKIVPKKEEKPAVNTNLNRQTLSYSIHNTLYPVQMVKKWMDVGCSWCSCIPTWTDKIWWFDKNAFVCNDCFNSKEQTLQDILSTSTVTLGKLVNE